MCCMKLTQKSVRQKMRNRRNDLRVGPVSPSDLGIEGSDGPEGASLAIRLSPQDAVDSRLGDGKLPGESNFTKASGGFDLGEHLSGGLVHGDPFYTYLDRPVNAQMNSNLAFAYTSAYIPGMNIAERIDLLMKLRGIPSQSALARASGVPQPTINRLLKGTTANPDLPTLQKLAIALSSNTTWLADGVGPGPDSPDHRPGKSAERETTPANSPNRTPNPGEIGRSERTEGRTISPSDQQTSTKRLRAALHDKGLTSSEIAAVTGVGIDTASQWLEGEGPEIDLAQAVSLQNAYGVNSVWLTKGMGDPGIAVRYTDEFRPIPITKWRAIPVVGRAQLGDNGHWADLEYPVGHGDGYIDFPTQDPNAYALKCEGDSMRPRIKAGEFVVIEPNQPIEPGDEVLVKSKDGRVMVKEFLYTRSGRTHLISANDAHKPIALADDEIEKMHFVRAICRPSSWRPE